MRRLTKCFLLLALLCLPAQAVGPLAFLAKEIVKSIVKSFVEDQINQMLATAGPCGLPMPGTGALTELVGALGGRSVPSLPALSGMSSVAGAARGAIPAVPGALAGGVPGTPAGAVARQLGAGAAAGMQTMDISALPPGMAEMMKQQMAQAQGLPNEQGAGADGRGAPGAPLDMAAAMQSIQSMQNSAPLSNAEIDELGTLLERMATAMPSAAPTCKPGDMKAMLAMAADSPMGGGMLRMLLEPMRDMQRQLDEARATFARMSEQERGEYVETMANEFRGWDKENRQALLGMMESNFLGMPDTMQTQLLARLKQEK